MRREDKLSGSEPKLLENFPRMPVAEDRVGRKVIGDLYKVGLGCRLLAGAGDPRLGIANNIMVAGNHSSTNQRRQRQNARGCIATRTSQEISMRNVLRPQFRMSNTAVLH